MDSGLNRVYAADQLVHTGHGSLAGIIVNSHTSGTFRVIDGLSAGAGRIMVDTWTLATGPQIITFPKPLDFVTGCFIDIGGTISYTPVWNAA